MGPSAGELDRLLADAFVEDLDHVPIDELRARRVACDEHEVGISYLRRLVQGRLDIVRAELQGRAEGTEGGLAALVERLPGILAPGVSGGGPGRLTTRMDPGVNHRDLTADLDRIVNVDRLGDLAELDEAEVSAVAEQLLELERRVSVTRRALHDRLDLIHAEIVRRYQTGEAAVDSLLQ